MTIITFLLLLAAALCFLGAAVNATVKVNLIGLGLLLWILVPLIAAGQALH